MRKGSYCLFLVGSIIIVSLVAIFILGNLISVSASAQSEVNNFSLPTQLTKQWILLDVFGDYSGITVGPDGCVYVSKIHGTVMKIAPNWGSIDMGQGFFWPQGLAADEEGNVYVADSGNNAVKKIYPNRTIVTLASEFKWPYGVAVDEVGNVYVADTYNKSVKKIFPNGTVVRLGNLPRATFEMPEGVAVDRQGTVYVASFYGGVHKIYPNGTTVGLAIDYPFRNLNGIAVDALGNVYVTDRNNDAAYLIYPNGTVVVVGKFFHPSGVAVDGQGNLYVVDEHTVSKLSPPEKAGIMPSLGWVGNPFWLLLLFNPMIAFGSVVCFGLATRKKWPVLMAIAWLYLKTYVYGAIGYWLGITVIISIVSHFTGRSGGGFFVTALWSLFFGAAMSLLLVGFHVRTVRSKNGLSVEALGALQVRDIPLSRTDSEAYDTCLEALKTISNVRIVHEDRCTGRIEARTPWYRQNSKISFEVRKETDKTSKIRVEIKPIIPISINDFGRNYSDIEKISESIQRPQVAPE